MNAKKGRSELVKEKTITKDEDSDRNMSFLFS